METIYLSLRAQVAVGTFFMESPVFRYYIFIVSILMERDFGIVLFGSFKFWAAQNFTKPLRPPPPYRT